MLVLNTGQGILQLFPYNVLRDCFFNLCYHLYLEVRFSKICLASFRACRQVASFYIGSAAISIVFTEKCRC